MPEVATRRKTTTLTCDPRPVCPACGGLECLCRPRFFAGQLLTDEDLTRLDAYIRGKHRLHNRTLHGWGVVNGLEVVCTACDDTATVTAGYALSPCGEDIVLCHDEVLDVCRLIKACRERDRTDVDCEPFRYQGDDGCRASEEEWILATCYDEAPTRGVAALRGSSQASCCTRCSCGGSAACGCDCHVKGNGHNGHRNAPRTPPAQCEPTAVCEGHRFRVYRAPARTKIDRERRSPTALQGEFGERYRCCRGAIPELDLPALAANPSLSQAVEAHRRLCALKIELEDFLRTHGAHDCGVARRLAGIAVPAPTQNAIAAFVAVYDGVRASLGAIRDELLRFCRCSVILPPAPGSAADNCVPLATVTVRGADCSILRVCNLGVRRFVLTAPAIQYWLSLFPVERLLSEYLEELCCGRRMDDDRLNRYLRMGAAALGQRFQAREARRTGVPRAYAAARGGEPEAGTVVARMTAEEIDHDDLWREAAFAELVAPFVERVGAEPTAREAPAAEEAEPVDPVRVRSELAYLRRTVGRNLERIDELINRLDET